MLSGDLSTASQSYTRAHTERIGATGTTCYLMATSFLYPAEPQPLLPAGYTADYTNCITDPAHSAIVSLFTMSVLSAEPRVVKMRTGWKKPQGAIGIADTFILFWLTQQL